MNIALLGYGTVGSGTYELFEKNKEFVKKKYNKNLNISTVVVRDVDKYKNHKNYEIFTTDASKAFEKNIDVVIELIGGINPAYEYIKKALENKKHVITANKDLIAEYFTELNSLAFENNVSLNYEASVAGGIPILKPLQNILPGNHIESIYGIINGTTNFILSHMYEKDMSYDDVLKIAQEKGFAESNPTSDVEGLDASRKLAILTMLTYNKKISWEEILTTGITNIDSIDIQYAKKLDKKIKLFAISKKTENGIYLGVRPVYIDKTNQLAKIDNEYNGIHLKSSLTGDLLFYGKGAGKFPTASSVFSDLVSILDNNKFKKLDLDESKVLKDYPIQSDWFIRFKSDDFSETSNKIFKVFKDHKFALNTMEFNKEITIKLYNMKEKLVKECLDNFINEEIKYYLILKGDDNDTN